MRMVKQRRRHVIVQAWWTTHRRWWRQREHFQRVVGRHEQTPRSELEGSGRGGNFADRTFGKGQL